MVGDLFRRHGLGGDKSGSFGNTGMPVDTLTLT